MSDNLTLAITKVGDLLLENKITKNANGDQISDINLVVPDYQRPYKWTAKNVIRLLDDIVDAKSKNKERYRVGTLILHNDSEDKSKYNIVDGQQRVITFSLLLKSFVPEGKVNFLEQKLANNPHNARNIPKNFLVLDRRVKNLDDRERSELRKYIEENCEFIVIITGDQSEAFQFFDSQNTRGKKLYPHDLLKAYHLREMSDLNVAETEKVVKIWEDIQQKELAVLFSEYLYRVKEWTKGNRSWELNEHNIHVFKGVTRKDNYPYAQFYKGAFSYAEMVNHSAMPFVSGMRNFKPFQLDTPIVAGKPFFEYAKHYFDILKDIQDNDKYEGYFINDNEIVKTLDLPTYKNGVGNRIARLLFDTAILLYVDRFCSEHPSKVDLEMLDQFVLFAFVWAYSLRAQLDRLGWQSAQSYIVGRDDICNSFNIYKEISDADSPIALLSVLSDMLSPLPHDEKNEGCYSSNQHFLFHFNKNNFIFMGDKKK